VGDEPLGLALAMREVATDPRVLATRGVELVPQALRMLAPPSAEHAHAVVDPWRALVVEQQDEVIVPRARGVREPGRPAPDDEITPGRGGVEVGVADQQAIRA